MDHPITVTMYTAHSTRYTRSIPWFLPLPNRPVPDANAIRNRIARYTTNPLDMTTAPDVLELRAQYEHLPAAWLLHTRPCQLTCVHTLRHWHMALVILALTPSMDTIASPYAQHNDPRFVALRAVTDEWKASVLRYYDDVLNHETAMFSQLALTYYHALDIPGYTPLDTMGDITDESPHENDQQLQ